MKVPTDMYHKNRIVHDFLRPILRRVWLFLAVFMVLITTTALYSFNTTPIYKATVQLLIERNVPQVLSVREAPSYEAGQEEFYQTQYKLLGGRALAKKVVDKLQLKDHRYYSAMFRELPPKADDTEKQKAEERLIDSILEGVEVSPVRGSRLVNVSFSHYDPQFAAHLVNTLARCYIEQSLDLRFAASQEAQGWLEQKLKEARYTLDGSEAKLNKYKREYNIIAVEDKEIITSQKLEHFNKEFAVAQTRRMEAETRFKEVNQGHPIPEVLNNPLIQNLKVHEAQTIAQLSELSQKFGDKHPRINRLNEELNATRGKIRVEMGQVVQGIKNAYKMALAQEENLKAAMEVQKGDTLDLSDRAIKYRVLLRDVETNRALYENMLKSLKTATATENLPATNIRIIYPATVPENPVKPRKFRNLLLATVAGIILGTTLAVGLDKIDTTLKTPDEMEEWLELPNLAMIPHIPTPPEEGPETPELVFHHSGESMVAESYRALRTSILFSTPGHPPRILLVTSTFPLEGKSISIANLANAMAKSGPQILLVDGDLRRPTLHQIFQVPKEPGLSNFLVGEINDLPVVKTEIPNLFLVPAGHIPPNPSELLGSERMQELLIMAQGQFDYVLIDSPPLASVTDPTILATKANGVLLVVRAEKTPRKAAIEARNQIQEVKAHIVGTVLNDIPFERRGYHYYNYYRYNPSYYSRYSQDQPLTPTKVRRFRKVKSNAANVITALKKRFNNKGKDTSTKG